MYDYDRRTARDLQLDLAWIEGLRKDFLTLLKNLPRVHDYKTAHELRAAVNIYRKNFEKVFFEHFLNHDLKQNSEVSESDAKWFDRELRGVAWSFSIELTVPIGYADEYRTEGACFAEFQREFPGWKTRIQRKAQAFWKEMKKFVDFMQARHGKPFNVHVPEEENVQFDGFNLVLHGFDQSSEYNVKELTIIEAGLRWYRARASAVAPILMRRQLPIIVEFAGTLDKGGEYNGSTITMFASSIVNKDPKWVAHVMAHEMGHHMWRSYLSGEAQKFWHETIRGDWGPIDLQELVDKWPGDAWAFQFPEIMGDKDPILALQVDAFTHDSSHKDVQSKADFQALLDSGVKTLVVPKHPITGYANKSPEEAFCEAIGLLVAHGPAALHEKVRWWLDTAMAGAIKVGSQSIPRR